MEGEGRPPAGGLVDIDGLGDLSGERHRIITNDWLAADMSGLGTSPRRRRSPAP